MCYVQKFKVKGTGQFPLDMLRYERCWPADSDMVLELVPPHTKEERVVELCRHVDFKKELPTAGRWQSYRWQVVEGSVKTFRR